MTGIASGGVLGLDLTESAKVVVEENKRIANLIGINPAARTTLTKPEGTASCVVGSSSGIHAWHNDYYIRRMRIGKNEAIYGYLKNKIPSLIEDCTFKPHIEAVVSFPQKAPDGAILRTESAEDLLARVLKFNKEWIAPGHTRGVQRHNVSCTISVRNDEWDSTGNFMWDNRNDYNGIAVLPYDGGTYVQAPFEDCSEEVFEEMIQMLEDLDLTQVMELEDSTSHNMEAACAGGQCTLE